MTLAEAYRTAVDLQARFGEEAGNVVAEWADQCLHTGDADGFNDWRKVCAMLAELSRTDHQTVH